MTVRMFVRHAVQDYDTWRRVYDDFDAERRRMGVTDHAVCREIDDPRKVTVWHDFASRADAESFAASDTLRQKMEEAGVAGEPTIWMTEPAETPAHAR